MRRTLTLAKESLVDLTPAELDAVAGAAVFWTPWCHVTIELGDRVREAVSIDCTSAC